VSRRPAGRAAAALIAATALAALALPACARRVPPDRPAAALYRDLERMVGFGETTGWHIDRIEIDRLMTGALESVCRTPVASRELLAGWLAAEIAALGGPVEEAYRKRGRSLDRVDALLTLSRIERTFAAARAAAAADCPFWIEPDPGFAGRQISDDRWQLSVGGGGKGILLRQGGETDASFGGAGRLLFGRTFGSRAALYAGLELGGNGRFPRGPDGERQNLEIGYDVVAPLVYRHTLVSSYLEVEAGWLGTGREAATDQLDHGVHLGVSFGARALRTRWFFPGGALGLSWERTFPTDGPPLYTVKLGFRGVIDLDL
jgi:hypothetical protein